MTHTFAGDTVVAFKEGDAPAVAMVIGATTTLCKAGEAYCQAGRQTAVHSEELAHGVV
jgi:hypothetical protein